MTKITADINKRVNDILGEQNLVIKERAALLHGIWAARVAQMHVLMLGPGGTAKSFVSRNVADHITGSTHFETAFDETTDPSQVFGPPDIKAMVEDGKTRRVITGMFPEATDAFLDEFFNGNGPLLHSIMPVLNERIFHNNGVPMPVPLRQALMGTNKLNADADQAALWDRVHLRYTVNYIQSRDSLADMVSQAIARMALHGRGVSTSLAGAQTTVSLDELDLAHKECLDLDVPENVIDTFLDIKDELRGAANIEISDRRTAEGMAAVLGNAWLRNHDEVKVGDLDILASMWWTVQEQQAAARGVILEATNPGEKAALDLLDELDKLKAEINSVNSADMDESRKKRAGVECVKNTDKLLREANDHLVKARAAGASTARIEECIGKADAFKVEVGKTIFNIDPNTVKALNDAAKV